MAFASKIKIQRSGLSIVKPRPAEPTEAELERLAANRRRNQAALAAAERDRTARRKRLAERGRRSPFRIAQ